MATNVVDLARARLAEAEIKRDRARIEMEEAEKEAEKYRDFVETAESLDASVSRNGTTAPIASVAPATVALVAPAVSVAAPAIRIRVQAKSLPGLSANLIADHGPLSLSDLVQRLEAMGKGSGDSFRAVLNSALWRRKKDLFYQTEDGRYDLRKVDVEFV